MQGKHTWHRYNNSGSMLWRKLSFANVGLDSTLNITLAYESLLNSIELLIATGSCLVDAICCCLPPELKN